MGPRDPTGEAHWVDMLNARTGLPNALAAQIWLDRDDLADVLAAYRELPLVRSVRHKPRTVPRADYRASFRPDRCTASAGGAAMRCSMRAG